MEQREIFEMIDSLYEPYLQVWQDVGNIESPTRCKALVDEVSQYFANMARQRGWKVDIMKSENAGDVVCITLNPDSKEAPICLSGHLDTVHAVGAFGSPAVHCDNEKIYGPGVTDCKGGVVAGFLAMDAVSRLGYRNRPVKLLLQTDEEVGSALSQKKTINYIIEQSKDAIAFLNLERNNPGTACLGRKGIVTFSFVVKGKAAHSSNCAEAGANAIVDAAYKMIELDKIKDKDGITCNCAIVNGGTVVNTVPDRCEFKVNVRYSTMQQYNEICEYVQKLAATAHVSGCECEVNQVGQRPAMEYCERNVALLCKLNEIYKNVGLPVLEAQTRTGGSDAAYVTNAEIPCVDSMGVAGGEIHTVNEFAYLLSLRDAAYRVAAAIWYL